MVIEIKDGIESGQVKDLFDLGLQPGQHQPTLVLKSLGPHQDYPKAGAADVINFL